MRKSFGYSIVKIFVFLYTLLDLYYNICGQCGRVIPFDKSKCPYCSVFQKNQIENKEMLSSMKILKRRYEKGEITKQEFEEIKKDLEE